MYSAVPQFKAAGLPALTYGSGAGPSVQDPLHLAQALAPMRPETSGTATTGAIDCDASCPQPRIEGPEAAMDLLWDRIDLAPHHRVHWATPPAVITARNFPGSPDNLAVTTASLAQIDPCLIEDLAPPPDPWRPSGTTGGADCRHACCYVDAAGPEASATALAALRHLDPDHQAQSTRQAGARAAALASLLCSPDPLLARRQLDTILSQTGVLETAALVQAALDHLQTRWMDGLISALQRQLAVTMLQSALRLWLDGTERATTVGGALISVLPGTPDMCGVMLKVALLRSAGWSVRLLLPQSPDDIRAVARDLQPDLIVLAGSRLSARPIDLAVLAGLLPCLAAATRAPIILGGKLAETEPRVLLHHGATAVCGAVSWIATIAADLAPAPAQPAAGDRRPPDRAAHRDDLALARFLAANRARRG